MLNRKLTEYNAVSLFFKTLQRFTSLQVIEYAGKGLINLAIAINYAFRPTCFMQTNIYTT